MRLFMLFAWGMIGAGVTWWLRQKPSGAPQEGASAEPRTRTAEEVRPRKAAPHAGRHNGKDDLKRVEGIGPKIESLLRQAGIRTWSDLADTSASELRSVLDEAGSRFRMHDPSTWPRQAGFAAAGKWDDLAAYQAELKAGREA